MPLVKSIIAVHVLGASLLFFAALHAINLPSLFNVFDPSTRTLVILPMADGFLFPNGKRCAKPQQYRGLNKANNSGRFSSSRLLEKHHLPFSSAGFDNKQYPRHSPSDSSLSMTIVAFDPPTHILSMSTFHDVATSVASLNLAIDREQAEALAGPFFGISLFPYLAFLWFLARPQNECPKGVTVGFATCLLFVFLTIPAAIASQVLYGVSLADCDWLHGSAESLLTITNLVTVIAFRQALTAKEQQQQSLLQNSIPMPLSATSWAPMTWLVVGLTVVAAATAAFPALTHPTVHTPYLEGFMDLPPAIASLGPHTEPENALTIATWIIHISSLVEFLVAMGFCWRWADIVSNPTWKGLTWGLLPLHSSGITACTYHLFFNRIPVLVPIQAFLTCVGNTTAAIATYRIARSNGWKPANVDEEWIILMDSLTNVPSTSTTLIDENVLSTADVQGSKMSTTLPAESAQSLVGFEDLGQALAGDNDYTFLLKLFGGCAAASYAIKYGELAFDFPFDANVYAGLVFIAVPSGLNAYKWYRRGKDPSFEGWF